MIMKGEVFLVLLIILSYTRGYTVTRHSIVYNNTGGKGAASAWHQSIDEFHVPPILCHNRGENCSTLGGTNIAQSHCRCFCTKSRSTFGFYNSVWGCTENSVVRKHAGCLYQFEGWTTQQSPLYTLPTVGKDDINWVSRLPAGATCKVVPGKSTYRKCDGSWGALDRDQVRQKVDIEQPAGAIYIGPYKKSSPIDPLLDGRIIRLAIECNNSAWNPIQCVALKLRGQIQCVAPTTRRPSNHGNIMIMERDLTTTTAPPTSAATEGARRGSSYSGVVSKAAVIGGSVGGAVLLVIILALITVLICMRRKTKLKKHQQKHEAVNRSYERRIILTSAQTNQALDATPNVRRASVLRPLPEPPKGGTDGNYQYPRADPSPGRSLFEVIEEPNPQGGDEPVYGTIDDNPTVTPAQNSTNMALEVPQANSTPAPKKAPKKAPAVRIVNISPQKPPEDKTSDDEGSVSSSNLSDYDIKDGDIPFSLVDTIPDRHRPDGQEAEPNSYGSGKYDVVGSQIPSTPPVPVRRYQNVPRPHHYENKDIVNFTGDQEEDKATYQTLWSKDNDPVTIIHT